LFSLVTSPSGIVIDFSIRGFDAVNIRRNKEQWRTTIVDSSAFSPSLKHEKPEAGMFKDVALTANPIMLGAYQLSE
jgi:hypothetical protein